MNYRSLAAHYSECNWIFYKFQDCENEHPYRKFLGCCGHIQKQLKECIKEQREIQRKENTQYRFKKLKRESSQQENSN